jgi:hypothetical protein
MEKIKAQLILSCIKNDPESFLTFLMSPEVKTETPNKKDFYEFFKGMLSHAHENSEGELLLRIEQTSLDSEKEVRNYNFYDNVHKHYRLSIVVKDSNNLIYLDVIPF